MAKCANCANNAAYEYKVTTGFTIDYCDTHLPKFLLAQKKAGLLKPTPVTVVELPVVSTKKKKATLTE